MTNQTLIKQLKAQNFQRVERDDRLFDILPKRETKEKGVELWEKWDSDTVHLVRLTAKRATKHSLPRKDIEQALQANRPLVGLEPSRLSKQLGKGNLSSAP